MWPRERLATGSLKWQCITIITIIIVIVVVVIIDDTPSPLKYSI